MSGLKKYRVIPHTLGNQTNGNKGKRMEVIFTSPMEPLEWQEFSATMIQMLKDNCLQWVFNLQSLTFPTSTDIGMWVTCNATVLSYSGKVDFLIRRNSDLQKVLSVTKLDQILNISIIWEADRFGQAKFLPFFSNLVRQDGLYNQLISTLYIFLSAHVKIMNDLLEVISTSPYW